MRGRYVGSWSAWVHLLSTNTNGNVGIGTTNPGYALDVNGTAAFRSTTYMYNSTLYAYESSSGKYMGFNTSSGVGKIGMTDTSAIELQAAGGHVGVATASPSLVFFVNGTSGGTGAWTNTSDERLKKDIVPISDALKIIEGLQGIRFDWRELNERSVGQSLKLATGQRQVGFIAQDVRKVLPEAVSVADDKDKLMGVQESKSFRS